MINPGDRDEQESLELLAGHVLGDLSELEQNQLEQFVRDGKNMVTLTELERTAAAVHLAIMGNPPNSLPDSLRNRILEQSELFLPRGIDRAEAPPRQKTLPEKGRASDVLMPNQPQDRPASSTTSGTLSASVSPPQTKELRTTRIAMREIIAWMACAASLTLALGLWWNSARNQPTLATASSAEARTQLISEATDLLRVEWGQGKTPFELPVGGDVVWSNERQTGFMRFVGMPVNDPMTEQYQLWIIDPDRDQEPIDGGVFDVGQDGEVVVAIDAKLAVLNPAAFAITVEKPGGVVVSTQENMPLLAAVP